MTKVSLFLFTLIICGTSVLTFDEKHTLKSVYMLFRHGDRAPQAGRFYKKDPHQYYDYGWIGYGGLTNEGKKREYQIGTALRERYDQFLSNTYRKKDIQAVSSDMERTKMSLLLALAGLYPPKRGQVWEDSLNWQPIPINYVPGAISPYIKSSSMCPEYRAEKIRVMNSKKYKKDLSRFNELMQNLTILTGDKIQQIGGILNLYLTLTAEMSMNLTLPEWTKEYYDAITEGALFAYETSSYTPKLRRFYGGMFLRKIVNDMGIENGFKPKNGPKIFLYSVHESNVAAVLCTLNLWKKRIPQYSSGIVFELHEKDSKQFIKILYYKGIPSEFEVQVIPGCEEYCPVEKFLDLVKDVLPVDILVECFGPPSDSALIPKSENPVEWVYDKLREWFLI